MARSPNPSPIAIKGTPRRLTAFVPAETVPLGNASLRFKAKGMEQESPVGVNLSETDIAGLNKIRLKIDRGTPPGSYPAELMVDQATQLVDLQIEPYIRLRAHPSNLNFSGKPGGIVTNDFMLMNRGNVPFDMPKVGVTGIFIDNGIETAFAKAYRSGSDDGLVMMKTFFETLKQGHGGLVKLNVKLGHGPLPAGTARLIRVSTKLSSELIGNRIYSGFWVLGNLNLVLQIEVKESGQRREVVK